VKYNYFYKITNIVNNKFYYGVHKTNNLNDSYLGSGVALGRAKKKYGKENFKREIIQFFDTYEECLAYEALIVDKDMINDPMCYNMQTGGIGGIPSKETKIKLREKATGRVFSVEAREKMRASHTGKKHSKEHCASISSAQKNISKETRSKMNTALIGRVFTKNSRAKINSVD